MSKKNGKAAQYNPLAAYERTDEYTDHLVKVDLGDHEIREYGQRLADNVRREIPKIKRQHEEANGPLQEQLTTLLQDRDYYLDQLASTEGSVVVPELEDSKRLAQTLSSIRSIEDQVRSLKLEHKVALDRLELENSVLEMRINLGYEMRPTPCEWWVDWSGGRKALVRCDSREIVLTKPLPAEDRQMSLGGDVSVEMHVVEPAEAEG